MTYLEVVNSILRRLREDEVGTVSENHYSKLVGAFVNDAKREVEDSWQWHTLQETVSVTTEAGIAAYDLEDYATDTYSNSIQARARPWMCLDATSDAYGTPLIVCTTDNKEKMIPAMEVSASLVERIANENDSYTAEPNYVYFTNNASADENKTNLRINFYPTPDGTYQYRLYLVNPQPTLATDTTDMKVPAQPVIQRAYLYCLYERGEEVGEMLSLTAAKAENALSDAIQFDLLSQGTSLSVFYA